MAHCHDKPVEEMPANHHGNTVVCSDGAGSRAGETQATCPAVSPAVTMVHTFVWESIPVSVLLTSNRVWDMQAIVHQMRATLDSEASLCFLELSR